MAVREKLTRQLGPAIDDTVIENVLRYGEAGIGQQYLDTIRESAANYADGIIRRLRDLEYSAKRRIGKDQGT